MGMAMAVCMALHMGRDRCHRLTEIAKGVKQLAETIDIMGIPRSSPCISHHTMSH